MNTKLIMTFSAICLGLGGIALSFLPYELQVYFGLHPGVSLSLIIQVLGALYFAFAMLNWMARGSFIGGIYNRPIAVANLTHFFMGSIALIKSVTSGSDTSYVVSPLAIL